MTELNISDDTLVLTEQMVEDYLSDHPEFFAERTQLLMSLKLPHQQRGAVSLVERQQELQRNRVAQLEEEITQLMSIARQNEAIFMAFSALYKEVIDCDSRDSLIDVIQSTMKEKLNVQRVKFYNKQELVDEIADGDKYAEAVKGIIDRRLEGGFYFGRMTKSELDLLFDEQHGDPVRSVAVMVVGEGDQRGVILFGSKDESHYFPGMDTLLLSELGTLITCMLTRFA